MIPNTITGFCPVLNKPYCISVHYHHVHSNEGDDYYIKGNFLCLHKKYSGKCRLGDSCPIHISSTCTYLMQPIN